jgi:hypothetical protein
MPVHCGPNEWIDATGYKWCAKFGTRDIADGCHAAHIDTEVLSTNKINLGSAIDLIWYGIRYMARVERLDRDTFYNERCTTKVFVAATEATIAAFSAAFETDEASAPDPPLAAPAAPGDSPTSTNSPGVPA